MKINHNTTMTNDNTSGDDDGATVTDKRIDVTATAIDHGVDAIAALGIVAIALGVGDVSSTVVGGLVTIALGKRALK